MTQNKTRIWFGFGSSLLLAGSTLPAIAAADKAEAAVPAAHAQHLNEPSATQGGEGGEAGYTHENPDQVFAVNLLLSKGHLHIAHEMAGVGRWDIAAAHAQHPAAETYDKLRPELKKRNAAPFEAELDLLVDAITEKKPREEVRQAYESVIAKIDAALGKIESAKGVSPAFIMSSAMALLKQASAEYVIGVSEGKVVNLQEYQDANGFAWVADQRIASLDPASPGLDEVRALLAKLKSLWSASAEMGSVVAPETDFLGTISRIELKAGKIK
ncbi:MAG: hypothetical protein ACOY2B_14715 [Pseudomonadota bacterium]